MLPPKQLGRFLLTLLIVYAALMAPWPGLKSGYAYLFRSCGNITFARFWFWPDGAVRFLDLYSLKPGDLAPGTPEIRPTGTLDTVMELRSRKAPGSFGYLRSSSRYVGYGPTAMVIALVVATPLGWRRRGWALLWGLVLVQAFIVLRLTLTLTVTGFAADKQYALFTLSSFWMDTLARVESLLTDNPTVSFVVPTIIWFIVALRGGMGAADSNRAADGAAQEHQT